MADETTLDTRQRPSAGDFRMEARRVGLDVSKSLFELHGVDQHGRVVLRKFVRSAHLNETFARIPWCVVGLESCGTAHRWGRALAGLGHEVRLIAPHVVAPYRERLELSASNAQVICEALGHASIPFTRVKADKRLGRLGPLWTPTQLLAELGLVARPQKGTSPRESGN